MVVGKTSSSSISKTEIFSKFSETQVLTSVFPEVTEVPCVIHSPLRNDEHPSFSIYMNNSGHIRYKDHSNSDVHGGLMDLLCEYWKCTFNQALDKICNLMIKNGEVVIKPKQIKTFTRKEVNHLTEMQVKVRPWRDYDYEYWASYGITKQWLKYAEIYPISHKIVTKRDSTTDKGKRYIFTADRYAYCYIERKNNELQLKVYQPFNTKGFKWSSKMDGSVIGLWTKIPEYGDKVIICSSLKDALCVSCQLHIPTLTLQGEGYSISDTAISELKRRYKKVFICFDTDEAGIEDGKKLADRTGFTNIIPDLGNEKDLSDYYKSLEDKEQFKQLQTLFN
jgi:5S rRNA maturation endonuclease (ribonuclease M5)